MLRETDLQPSLWEALLADEAKRLPAELAKIDAYLDDERFLAPWRTLFDRRLGRPSVPIDTLLRLLYLKHRYGLGYETLCREVADSISWRRFCAGFIADHQLQQGNPPDAPQLVPAVERVIAVTGQAPGTVVGERGFGTAANDQAMETLGVKRSDCSAPAPGQGATGA